jgi:hypothetical protein
LVQIIDNSDPITAQGMDKDTAMSMLPGQQDNPIGTAGVPQQPKDPSLDELM